MVSFSYGDSKKNWGPAGHNNLPRTPDHIQYSLPFEINHNPVYYEIRWSIAETEEVCPLFTSTSVE